MENKILSDAKKYYQEYIARAEEYYEEVPEHCFHSQIKLVDESDEELANSSGADLIENCIYVNPNTSDLEWLIYHEMEHVRCALNIGKTHSTGLYIVDKNENGETVTSGESINEGVVELAVEELLGRKQELVGYYESTAIVSQIGAALGMNDKEFIDNCNDEDGREYIKYTINGHIGDERNKFFDELACIIDALHYYHMLDMEKEYEEFGEITVKPLGKYESDQTKKYRKLVQERIKEIPLFAKRCGNISEDEYNRRIEKINVLSPYTQNQSETG